jgi:hypothetical protein
MHGRQVRNSRDGWTVLPVPWQFGPRHRMNENNRTSTFQLLEQGLEPRVAQVDAVGV